MNSFYSQEELKQIGFYLLGKMYWLVKKQVYIIRVLYQLAIM
ncbi:Uncharacterised protein [Bacillus cereus]|nr:Uncharacterised protein [Bacillus cereus]